MRSRHEGIVVTRATAPTLADGVQAPDFDRTLHVSTSLSVESIYAQHAGFMWRVLRGMGVPDDQVEDALQDVFVVVHRRLQEFDGRCAVRTWLFAIAYRVACDYRRKLRRTRTHTEIADELQDHAPGPEHDAEKAQAARLLSSLLDRLSDEKRVVLVLSEAEGMTVPEIAALTDTGVQTVYTRLRRAREELDRALAIYKKRMR